MNIFILSDGMRITVENNKILTEIVGLVDGTPLRWHVISDVSVVIIGRKELLYKLLWDLTAKYFGKIEIC